MIHIDEIIKLQEFPSFLKYLKFSFIDNLSLLIPFFILIYMFTDKFYLFILLLISYIFINGLIQYRLDKQIWLALKDKKY
jgi:hypothetical protein